MLEGLTASAHRCCWIWSIDDSAYHTLPGKFLLHHWDSVSDLHLITCFQMDLTCRNRLDGLLGQRHALFLRTVCYISVANTGLCELLIWAGY